MKTLIKVPKFLVLKHIAKPKAKYITQSDIALKLMKYAKA